ncbi:MAG TPA: PKD domain-containing protein, partial [Bacteroidia bacterium]|nr:PKD domain-containing protein [Bacteroidia bacterium]
SPNVGSTATVNNLAAGTYTVTVSNAGGCATTQTITITQPTAITATQSQVNVLCNGASTGSATVNPSGGAGGYTYTWSPTGGNASTAINLSATNYSCTITDANGCTNTQTFSLTSPSAITVATSSTPSVCGSPNGSATVSPSGGAGGYTYSWSSGGNAATENNLTGGSYTCTVTDANGCTQQAVVNVVGASTPSVTVTSSTNILCNGNSTGSATVTPSGGQGPYSYSWTSGGNAATENNLPAGSYSCTITDANGCTATSSVTLTEPPLLTSSLTSTDVLCNGGATGSATMTANGGNSGYVYVWSPSGGNASVANNLTAQSYTCTVTDANGCTTSQSVTITEPTALTSTVSQVDELCSGSNNGSATVNPSGGAGSYTYTWNPNVGSAATAANILAGSYTCTITDANGCTLTESFTITEPATVVASQGAITNVLCNGQSTGVINVNQAGGTSPYSYTWSPNVSTANSASSLAAGSYNITVTDANGCSSTVTITITEPPLLTVAASANPASICSGQNVILSAIPAGGNGACVYTWMPGNLSGNNPNVSPAATTTYSVTATDANGCTANSTALVTVAPNPVAAFSSDIQSGCDPVCVNFADQSTIANPGVISAWTWDFGDGNTSNSQNPSHCYTTPGVYTVIHTAKSTDGCTSSVTTTSYISVFVNPVAEFSASPQPTSIVNPQIYFTDASSNASSWSWSFGDALNSTSTQQNPTFIYGQPICYDVLLTVTSSDGCVDTVTHPVCIDADVSFYVPNAFTPNQDGKNEIFLPVGIGIDPDKYQLWIFDRWGNLLFTTTDLNAGWDGKVQGHSDYCQQDTYVWKIVAKDMNGLSHSLIGGVSLIR